MSLPSNTTLPQMATAMGIAPGVINALTPEVKALTKADLIALGEWGGAGQAPNHLTLNDVNSIKTVFGGVIANPGGVQANVACCCCPCCSAAAVLKA